MTEPVSKNINLKQQAKSGSSWPREIAFAMIAIGTGIGAGVILKNKEVTDDPKSLGIAGGVTITTYGILKLLFRQHQNESQSLTKPIPATPEAHLEGRVQAETRSTPGKTADLAVINEAHEEKKIEKSSSKLEESDTQPNNEPNNLLDLNPGTKAPLEQTATIEKTEATDPTIDFASLVEGENDRQSEKKEVSFNSPEPHEPIKSILKKQDPIYPDAYDSDTDASIANTSIGSDVNGYYTSEGEEAYDSRYGDDSNNSFLDEFGEDED